MSGPPAIVLRGVRVHNLRAIDVEIPLQALIVFTGVSGAGKSSLAFDTLDAEAQRRYLQSFSATTRQFLERFDRPDAEWIGDLPPAIAIGRRAASPGPRATVGSLTEVGDYLRLLLARAGTVHCPTCGQELQASQPQDMIDAALAQPAGTRVTVAFAAEAGTDDWVETLREQGFVRVQIAGRVHRLDEPARPVVSAGSAVWVLVDRLEPGAESAGRLADSVETAFARGGGRAALLTDTSERVFDRRLRCPHCQTDFPDLEPRLFDRDDPLGACSVCGGTGRTRDDAPCPTCDGLGWNEAARAVRLGGREITALNGMSLAELADFLAEVNLPAARVVKCGFLLDQLRRRLALLNAIDLGYLAPGRSAATLAAGELRRARLATALDASLVNALYVIDEPSVGLHPRDLAKLLAELVRLRDAGNTVVVIEHDRAVIAAADHVIDLGPGAGAEGGRVTYQGLPVGLADVAAPTGDWWAGRAASAVPVRRRRPAGRLRLSGARTHNLKDLTVEFPLGVLCVVTGVSGAGKSSLVEETLYPALVQGGKKRVAKQTAAQLAGAEQVQDVVLMDQEPLPRTGRTNPATYLKIFDDIRALFAETTEARARGYDAGHFSFNQPGGRCETCAGQGSLTVEMQFLADVSATCPECRGSRYRKDVLDVRVRSLNVAEVLALTAREAFRFFRAQPLIGRRLKPLLDVGLDYLRLGQPFDTLSGGECQRLKLAAHLAASRKPRTLFLLLEPTAGLHPADVARLLDCLARLLESGHSLIVVEHDLDVIKCADYVIDLGPEAGDAGGFIVAVGTPEEVAQVESSQTGRWLRRVLPRNGAGEGTSN